MRRTLLELDEPVAVAVAVTVDPLERLERRLLELLRDRDVVGPAPHLREEDQVERRRVERPVVAAEPVLRRLAVAHLVHDLARLRVDRRIVLVGLERRERGERVARELGAEQQRLQARDQRVAPEHRHEPRHAGGRELHDARLLRAAHPQRREIGSPTGRTSCSSSTHSARNCGTRSCHAARESRTRPRSSPKRRSIVCRHKHVAVRHGDDVDAHLPALSRLELDGERDAGAVHPARAREDDLRAQRVVGVLEHELVVLGFEAGTAPAREAASRARGSPSAKSCCFTERMSAKSAAELEPELERDAGPSTRSRARRRPASLRRRSARA